MVLFLYHFHHGAQHRETTQKVYDIQIAVSQIFGELLRHICHHGMFICPLFLVGITFSHAECFRVVCGWFSKVMSFSRNKPKNSNLRVLQNIPRAMN